MRCSTARTGRGCGFSRRTSERGGRLSSLSRGVVAGGHYRSCPACKVCYTSAMVVALRNQVEASERSAVELRPRMASPSPTWADLRPEIEAMMAVLLGQFDTMRDLLHRYQDAKVWRSGDGRIFHE